jgi:hypothetical protein
VDDACDSIRRVDADAGGKTFPSMMIVEDQCPLGRFEPRLIRPSIQSLVQRLNADVEHEYLVE